MGGARGAGTRSAYAAPAGARAVLVGPRPYGARVQLRYAYRLNPTPGQRIAAREGVRLRPGGVQRRDRRPPRRPRGRGAVSDRRRPVQGADDGEADPGAGVAGRRLRRRAATSTGRREHRLPQLLRVGEGRAQGPQARCAAVPVQAGPGPVDPVHPGGPVQGHLSGSAAAARGRGRTGALVPRAAGRGVKRDGHRGRDRPVPRLVRRRRPRPAPPADRSRGRDRPRAGALRGAVRRAEGGQPADRPQGGRKLRRAQQELARKQKGSANRAKAVHRVARCTQGSPTPAGTGCTSCRPR